MFLKISTYFKNNTKFEKNTLHWDNGNNDNIY